MALIEDIYVKIDDGRVLKTCKYSYSDFLKLTTLNKFINIGEETIVTSHIVSFWRE